MIPIAFLIPIKIIKLDNNSDIYKLLTNFSKNMQTHYKYNFYLGFNHADPCLQNTNIFNCFNNEHFTVTTIEFDKSIQSGHLTKMWNVLFDKSYKNNEYFYQLGDDIFFPNYHFIDKYISVLQKTNNLGVTGYLTINGNNNILTQSFVSKKHYDIFGFYFPESIKNWYCDNWISNVYKLFHLYHPLEKCIVNKYDSYRYIRYIPNKSPFNFLLERKKGVLKLLNYLKKKY